jgi:TonB family protein
VVPPPPSQPALEPAPEPAKPAEAPPPPRPVPHERPRARPAAEVPRALPPKELPPPDRPPDSDDSSTTPVFGVTMESTSQAGRGPAVPIGNSPRAPQRRETKPDQPASAPPAAPVAAYEVTVMPLPQGRCTPRYTDEARQAAAEGTVVLDLIVGETGRTREIKVVSGLPYGLTEAAVAALKECRFTPGEKDGTPVPVRVRGFKVRFVRQDQD